MAHEDVLWLRIQLYNRHGKSYIKALIRSNISTVYAEATQPQSPPPLQAILHTDKCTRAGSKNQKQKGRKGRSSTSEDTFRPVAVRIRVAAHGV